MRSPAHPTIALRQPRTRRARVRQDAGVTRPDESRAAGRPSRRGPGRPRRSAPPGTARARTSRCGRPGAEAVELCLFDADGDARPASPLTETTYHVWHGYAARHRPRPALRLPGARAVRPGDRAALQPGQAAARPVRARGRRRVRPDHALFGVRPATRRRREPPDSAPYVPRVGGRPRRVPVGRRHAAARRPGTTPSSTSCTCAGFTMRHPDVPPDAARHVRRAGPPGRDRAPAGLGVTAVELLPVHQFVTEPHAAPARPAQLLGLQLDRLLRPARRVRSAGARASRCASSRRWCGRCTRPASR